MRKFIARRMLRGFGKRYGYDTSYMELVLRESPSAFFKFAPVMKASAHREVIPRWRLASPPRSRGRWLKIAGHAPN
jgi:hypothetical protein